jgi:uncharacterized membrane protein YuzA (DUF378 family)
MDWRRITRWLLVGVTAALIVWDIVAVVFGGGSATISDVVLDTAKVYPILPFALGVVCGHLFWPQERDG